MIESLSNEKVLLWKKLREKKYILENNMFIVEGKHLVEEASNANLLMYTISSSEVNYNVKNYLVSKKVLESISLLKSVPNVMGVVKLVNNKEIIGDKIIILDNVQDPGNVGTIIRSARAFNVNTVILSSDSVNIYNDKLIRSTEGTIFNMNVITMDIKEAIDKVKQMNIKTYYADMYGKYELSEIKETKYALVMGSEGKGISEYIKSNLDESIRIDMNNKCESLNVAATSAIIMYQMRG